MDRNSAIEAAAAANFARCRLCDCTKSKGKERWRPEEEK